MSDVFTPDQVAVVRTIAAEIIGTALRGADRRIGAALSDAPAICRGVADSAAKALECEPVGDAPEGISSVVARLGAAAAKFNADFVAAWAALHATPEIEGGAAIGHHADADTPPRIAAASGNDRGASPRPERLQNNGR